MSKKILLSILVIVVAIGLVGVGTYALWSDTVVSESDTFTTGSLALQVNGSDAPAALSFSNAKPGDSHEYVYVAKNIGSIPGKLTVSGVFTGPMGHTLVVSSVKVDNIEQLLGGSYYLDSVPGGILAITPYTLAAGADSVIKITILMPEEETGHMSETETGNLTFRLDQ